MYKINFFKIKKVNLVLSFFSIAAFWVAIAQPFGLSPDYLNYDFFFDQLRIDFLGQLQENRFEPGFSYVAGWLVKIFSSNAVVYGFLVLFAVTVKFICLAQYSREKFFVSIACVFYLIRFFPLLELTALRASLAIAFIFLALYYIANGKRFRGIIACGLAFANHYSSLIIAPFLFMPRLSRRTSVLIALIIYGCLYLFSRYAVGIAGNFFQVFQSYEAEGYGRNEINIFSPVFFPEFFMILAAYWYWNDITEGMRKIAALELIGFAILYALLDFQVIAVRGRELFSALWPIFIVQAAVCSSRVKLVIYIFIGASLILAGYLYWALDFFIR